MAPPAKSAVRPGRSLISLAALLLIMLLGILGGNLFTPGHWHKSFKVGLGLDLSSGTEVSMKAVTSKGGVPSADELNETVSILTSRVNGTGNSGATVQTQGKDIVTVSIPGKTGGDVVSLVSTTALLRFRQVLLEGQGSAQAAATPSTPSTSPSAQASSSPTVSPSHSASTSPSAHATSTAKTAALIRPDAGPSPSAQGSASPHASSSAPASPSPTPATSTPASTPATSGSTLGNASMVKPAVLKLFDEMNCPVDPTHQDAWKKSVKYKDSSQWDDLGSQIVSCDTSSGTKYALDVAKVDGKDVTSASAQLNSNGAGWLVLLSFDGKGSDAFGALTTDVYNKYYVNISSDPNNQALAQVAIVLDGNVVSAPDIQQPITGGNAQISGSTASPFTQQQATQLANVLKFGSLPVSLSLQNVTSISATLGSNQLSAGLIAAGIGLALVVLYALFYYRGLSLVSISSLGVAAMIGYFAIVLLSKYQGFTLNLAGIAGLIVAIGITADSFIVFFERIRDEVRDGKQLRPAVEAGWKRARRTILVSDTVSFLAALLLYYFAISDVKGFAYTLGLTTIIDVVVVILFTKPLMTLAARSKFFGSGGRWSGLDPARLGARTPWRSSVRRTTSRTGARRSTRTTGEA